MSATPPGGDRRGGARRILPSVAEVAAALGRNVSADPAALYRVSREVVTGELARVKQGQEAAPLEILVARAEERFREVHPVTEVPKQPDLFAPPTPGPPPLPEPPPAAAGPLLPVPYEPPEEPFAAATSAELAWDRSNDGEVPPPVVSPAESRPGPAEEESVEPSPMGAADVVMGEEPAEGAPGAVSSGDAAARRSLWILAVAAVVVIAAGLFWLVGKLLAPSSAPLRGASTTKVESPMPPILPQASAPAQAPASTHVPAPVTAPAAAPAGGKSVPGKPIHARPAAKPASAAKAPAPPAPASGRVASFFTRDWAGHPPVFIVHFASHQDRAAAAGDAAKLVSTLGKPARAVEVDLGAKGIWYRVVVGEFPTADEARAYRAALAAKNTPGMGFVYEMRGER